MYENQIEVLDGVKEAFLGVVNTIIDKDIGITFDEVVEKSPEEYSYAIYTKINFQSGLTGPWAIGMEEKLAANLSDMMLAGEGKNEFEDEDVDAFIELVNQLIGGAVSTLSTNLGQSISMEEVNFVPETPDFEGVVFTYDFVIEGKLESKLYLIVDKNNIDELEVSMGAGESVTDSSAAQSTQSAGSAMEKEVQSAELGELNPSGGAAKSGAQSIEMLMNVNLKITVKLGDTEMLVKELLNLGPGSVIELNKLAGEPIDILANETLIAKGEVVVVDENFGVRITSLVSPEERLESVQ